MGFEQNLQKFSQILKNTDKQSILLTEMLLAARYTDGERSPTITPTGKAFNTISKLLISSVY